MNRSLTIASVYAFATLTTLASFCLAEPPIFDLTQSTDPDLVEARKYHPQYAAPGVADQKKTETAFLRFIEANPDHELVPLILLQIGYCYTGFVTPEAEKLGAVWDRQKAISYFDRVIKSHPAGKVSLILLDAECNAASLAPPAESARRYVAFYQHLESLSEAEVDRRIWFTKQQELWLQTGAWRREESVKGFLNHVKQMKETASRNIPYVFDAITDEATRIVVLRQAVEALPDTPVADAARKRLEALGQPVTPQQPAAPATTSPSNP